MGMVLVQTPRFRALVVLIVVDVALFPGLCRRRRRRRLPFLLSVRSVSLLMWKARCRRRECLSRHGLRPLGLVVLWAAAVEKGIPGGRCAWDGGDVMSGYYCVECWWDG